MTTDMISMPPAPKGTRSGDTPIGWLGRLLKILPAALLLTVAGLLVKGGTAIGDAHARLATVEGKCVEHTAAIEAQRSRVDKLQADIAFMRGGLEARFSVAERAAADRAEAKAREDIDRARLRPLPGAP